MSLKHILGIDHIVVAVRDLHAAAAEWNRLGFTVSPRGTHSAHIGSCNHTIVFGDDYLELLGALRETDHNQPLVAFLRKREGIERVAFRTDNAAAGVTELNGRGVSAGGPLYFERPVDFSNGSKGEAKFNILTWPSKDAPGDLGIFACEHLTPETVWIPELQTHANGAKGLIRVEVLSAKPADDAAQLARLIDQPVQETADGYRVSSGNRATFLYYDAAAFAQRYPETVRRGAAPNGGVALVIAADDLAKARSISSAIAHGESVSIPAHAATGAILSFVRA